MPLQQQLIKKNNSDKTKELTFRKFFYYLLNLRQHFLS